MSGYIIYDNLNSELQQMINTGNSVKAIAPVSVETNYSSNSYPYGVGMFSLSYNPNKVQSTDTLAMAWARTVYGLDANDEVPSTVLFISTLKKESETNVDAIAFQLIEVIRNNLAFAKYLRVNDGSNWSAFSQYPTVDPAAPVVRAVNAKLPNSSGNVDTDFRIIDPIAPDASPQVYPEGNSEFVVDREATIRQISAIEEDWGDLFPIEPGRVNTDELARISVRTYRDDRNMVFLQEVDANENGFYEATDYRFSNDGLSWSTFRKVPRVRTVNGIAPDENGNVQINIPSGGGGGEKPIVTHYTTDMPTESGNANQDLLYTIAIPNYNPNTDNLAFYRMGSNWQRIDMDYIEILGYDNGELTFLLSQSAGTVGEIDIWRFTYNENSNGVCLPEVLYSYYVPTDPNNQTIEFSMDLPNYNPDTDFVELWVGISKVPPYTYAITGHTDTEISFELYDGMYLTPSTAAQLYVYRYNCSNSGGGSSNILVIDSLMSNSRVDALSANQGNVIKQILDQLELDIEMVYGDLHQHIGEVATPTTTGHVMVDDNTITVDQYGKVRVSQNITATINTNSRISRENESNIVYLDGLLDIHVNKIASTTELGHVKIDGSTITIDSNGVISAIGGGSGSVSEYFRIDNTKSIASMLAGYQEGITLTFITKGSAGSGGTNNVVNSQLGWAIPNISIIDYVMETTKTTNYANQKLYAYYESNDDYYLIGELTRKSSNNIQGFSDEWTSKTIMVNKVNSNESNPIGMNGMLMHEISTGKIYANYNTQHPSNSNWEVISDNIQVIDGLTSSSETDALSARQGNVLALITQALANDIIADRQEFNNHTLKVASTTELGHVKIDGTSITVDSNGVISATSGNEIIVVDNLDSQSATDALSANQGRTLWYLNVAANGRIDALDADLYSYETRLNQHILEVASETNLGHVKVDGTSITIDNGVISATPSDITVIDALDSNSTTDALSANQGMQLEEGLHNLYNDTVNISIRTTNAQNDIDNHIPERGTSTDFGHVKVDGTTIVSNDGVISAVGGGSGSNILVVNSLNSTSETDALSANQGRIMDGKLTNHSRVVATEFDLGHVMVDNDTIKVTSFGEISVDFSDIENQIAMIDSETSQNGGHINFLETSLNNHAATKATETVLGHVKVDGTSIIAIDGVISATTQPNPVIIDTLTSTSTDEVLSANQGRVIKGLIDNASSNITTVTNNLQTQIGRITDNENAIDALETATSNLTSGKTLYYNASGAVTRQIKEYNGIASVVGNEGLITVNLAHVGFTEIISVQMTAINGGAADADAPMAAQVRGLTPQQLGAKLYRATSAGLLAAMQQTPAAAGSQVFVTVKGY